MYFLRICCQTKLYCHCTSVMPALQVHIWARLDIINNKWLKVGRPVLIMFIASFTKIHHWFKSYLWGQRCWYHGPILPYKLRKQILYAGKHYVWEHSCEDYCLLGCDVVGQWWATFWAHGPNQEKKVPACYIINSTFFSRVSLMTMCILCFVARSTECISVAGHSSQHNITQHGMLPQHPTCTTKLICEYF